MSSGFKIIKEKRFLTILDLKKERKTREKNIGIIYACFSQAQDINRYKLERVREKKAAVVPTLQWKCNYLLLS